MNRGDLFRVYKGNKQDPKKYRVFVIVSRQILITTKFSTVICAPVYTNYSGVSTQIKIGIKEGLKHDSYISCDELMSLPKSIVTDYIGTLSDEKIEDLNEALKTAIGIDDD